MKGRKENGGKKDGEIEIEMSALVDPAKVFSQVFSQEERVTVRARKEITIGAFLGLVTEEGKVRLRMRTEKGSVLGKNVSYKGDFELPGGGVKQKDLNKVLTMQGLFKEAIRETKEEIGDVILGNINELIIDGPVYRAVYKFPDGKKEDWAFMIPIPPECWDEDVQILKKGAKTVDVNTWQLNVLGEIGLIVSGIKRMYRMAMAALYAYGSGPTREKAAAYLTNIQPGWRRWEFFSNGADALDAFRRQAQY